MTSYREILEAEEQLHHLRESYLVDRGWVHMPGLKPVTLQHYKKDGVTDIAAVCVIIQRKADARDRRTDHIPSP